MKVWDCFSYWRETWAVELRLRLWAAVAPDIEYIPVAFYGDRTHRGAPIPEPVIDPRCWSVKVTLDAGSDWGRANQQRDAITEFAARDYFAPDDLVFLVDADEIVNPARVPAIIHQLIGARTYQKLAMQMYLFGASWLMPHIWTHPAAFFARDLPAQPSLHVRENLAQPSVADAGWHFTYIDDIDSKFKAFPHSEYDTPDMLRQFESAKTTGILGPYQLAVAPLQGVAGDLMREILPAHGL